MTLNRLLNDVNEIINQELRRFDHYPPMYITPQQQVRKGNVERKFKDGMLHCEDGPAVIKYKENTLQVEEEQYFLNGEKVTKEAIENLKATKEDREIFDLYVYSRDAEKADRISVTGKQWKEIKKLLK